MVSSTDLTIFGLGLAIPIPLIKYFFKILPEITVTYDPVLSKKLRGWSYEDKLGLSAHLAFYYGFLILGMTTFVMLMRVFTKDNSRPIIREETKSVKVFNRLIK